MGIVKTKQYEIPTDEELLELIAKVIYTMGVMAYTDGEEKGDWKQLKKLYPQGARFATRGAGQIMAVYKEMIDHIKAEEDRWRRAYWAQRRELDPGGMMENGDGDNKGKK